MDNKRRTLGVVGCRRGGCLRRVRVVTSSSSFHLTRKLYQRYTFVRLQLQFGMFDTALHAHQLSWDRYCDVIGSKLAVASVVRPASDFCAVALHVCVTRRGPSHNNYSSTKHQVSAKGLSRVNLAKQRVLRLCLWHEPLMFLH